MEKYVWCEDCDALFSCAEYDPEKAVPCCPICDSVMTCAPATMGIDTDAIYGEGK